MAMTRQERVALHTNQKRMQFGSDMPNERSLVEGKPEYRETSKGLYQYIKHNNEVYSRLFTRNTKTLEEEINDTVNNITINEITISGILGVDSGGTGLATITDGAVMLGSGTGVVTPLAVTTNGAILIGDGTTDPTTLNAFSSSTGTLNVASGGTGQTSVTNFKNVLDDETWTFANNVTATGRVIVDSTTDATSITDGSLQTDGGLSVTLDAMFGNDIRLLTDASVFNMGDGNDFTITHDGTTGATLAGNPITITSAGAATWSTTSGALTVDSAASTLTLDGHTGVTVQSSNSGDITLDSVADIVLDAAGGNFEFKDATVGKLTIDVDGTAGDIDINLVADGDDLVFNQRDDSEVLRLTDGSLVVIRDCYVTDYAINIKADAGGLHYTSSIADFEQNYSMLAKHYESTAHNADYGA